MSAEFVTSQQATQVAIDEISRLQSDLSAARAECGRYRSENASLRNQMVMRFADMPGVQRGIQDCDSDRVAVIERHDFCSPQFRNVWIVPAGSFPHLEEGYAQQARQALEAK